MATKRITKELTSYSKEPSPSIPSLQPTSESDLYNLTAQITGPEGTAYEGGLFTLNLTLPPSYPNSPPTITFATPICHANVSFSTGEICLDLLKTGWTPAYGLVSTLEAIRQLLAAGGEPDSPLNVDLAKLQRNGDYVGAEALVRFYTGIYARRR